MLKALIPNSDKIPRIPTNLNFVMSSHQAEQAQLLIDTFEMLGDWEERYRFLIDLGRDMPAMDDSDKVDANKVSGCLSSVWITADTNDNGGEQVVEFVADSDSAIVKGLISMLRKVYSGQTPQAIVDFDVEDLFGKLGLGQHLSVGRRNGLSEMVRRIKRLATELAAA